MTESTKGMLTEYVENAAETIREYARQIESAEYGNRWTITDDDGNQHVTIADSESSAYEIIVSENTTALTGEPDTWVIELDEFDEPTIVDEYGNESPISEFPISVEVKIGRPLAVVIGTGGPHIEIVQDLSDGPAKLAGYWGSENVYRYGDEFQTVLDYLTDSLYDEAPEEWK
ncbi:hypothetical protein PBI_HENRY_136 [Mycobacterium phage Henry]|uniref:Uncharacterized protein n=1 Tax=Mycobacterium phage Henry TaxID=1034105 RepID=G1D2I6_9CAUD|nr:hypothetical protein PBI_HENRY_136 [Mycobacterium phage Henry]